MNVIGFLCVILAGMACSSRCQYVQITGVVHTKEAVVKVFMYQVKDGIQQRYDSAFVQATGKFEIKTEIEEEGFYTIGYDEKRQHPLYLKPGDNVSIAIYDWYASLEGQNTKENTTLYEWEKVVESLRSGAFFSEKLSQSERSVFLDFFSLLEKVAGNMEACIEKVNTKNRKFDRLMKKKIYYDMDFYALHYLEAPRREMPIRSELSPFYRTVVSKEKHKDNDILKLPWGRLALIEYMKFAIWNDSPGDDSDRKALSSVGTNDLRGEYLLDRAERRYKSYDELVRMLEEYEGYFTLPSQKVRLELIREKLAYSKPGTPAPNFSCNDREGNRVVLSDFLGKLVIVDVWATWCAPCRKQMPYMKKLEEEFHGKDVVFITMCIGAEIERSEWLKILVKEKLGGIQVFMPGWNSQFAKDYKISGIPRFMIINKEGRIVSVRAPAPSNPKLKKMIEEELKK